jgi:hypothetical protein
MEYRHSTENKEKKQVYWKFLQRNSATDRTEYKLRSATEKREIRKINRQHWNRYVADLEYDVHGRQDKAYKIIKELNEREKDTICLNPASTPMGRVFEYILENIIYPLQDI